MPPREQWSSRDEATKSAPLPGAVSPQLSRKSSGRKAPVLTRARADTDHGRARQPSFKGMREDKLAKEVQRCPPSALVRQNERV